MKTRHGNSTFHHSPRPAAGQGGRVSSIREDSSRRCFGPVPAGGPACCKKAS